MRDHYSMVHFLYELFYKKFYTNKNYKFIPTEDALKKIEKFIILLDKQYKLETISLNFLISYFIFQFNYWSDLKIKSFNERISLSFIIGSKAFERWISRDQNFDWTLYTFKFTEKYGISISYIKDFFSEQEISQLNKAEEIEKKRFSNTERGLLNCIERTTLFNHKSQICLLCKDKCDCKKLLKDNYYQIFIQRGYVTK